MIGGRRESALRLNARVLDRAVHDTVPRLWPLAVPFVLLDASGFLYSFPFQGWWLTEALYEGLVANRSYVLFAASIVHYGGRRIAVRSLVRYLGALLLLPLATLFQLPDKLLPGILLLPFVAARDPFGSPMGPVVTLAVVAGAEVLLVAALALILLASFVGVAASMDVVADGTPAWLALHRWLRWSFRRRTFGSTLLAATIFMLMFLGTTEFTSELFYRLIPGPGWVDAVAGIPNGISDTLGFAFVWQWRKAVIDRELGRDLIAALETAAAPPVPAGSVP